MAEIPGPFGGILTPGGYVGAERITQRGPTTYVGNAPLSSQGDYLGNTRIAQDSAGRIWLGGELVTFSGGIPYVGNRRVTSR